MFENNFDISKLTSFKIGGKIKKVYFPKSTAEFVKVLDLEPEAVVVGNLSNVIVSSYGYDGVVVCTRHINEIKINSNIITASAGVRGTKLANIAAEKGLSGLEFMIAFPGSVGGEVYMNAGAHGQCVSDVLYAAKLYSKENGVVVLNNEDMKFSYRKSVCQESTYVVLEASFLLKPDTVENIKNKMNDNLVFRQSKQPSLVLPNCGSVFKNPEGYSAGMLLESVGAKKMVSGGAKVFEGHANFIINNNGTSLDILTLMYKMSSAVEEKYGIKLVPEVKFLGENNQDEVELCRKLKIGLIKTQK